MNKEIVICTHGKFGEELVHSAEMIVGPMKNIEKFSRYCLQLIRLLTEVKSNNISVVNRKQDFYV